MLNTEFRAMKIDIDKLTESELIDLNNRVVARPGITDGRSDICDAIYGRVLDREN